MAWSSPSCHPSPPSRVGSLPAFSTAQSLGSEETVDDTISREKRDEGGFGEQERVLGRGKGNARGEPRARGRRTGTRGVEDNTCGAARRVIFIVLAKFVNS